MRVKQSSQVEQHKKRHTAMRPTFSAGDAVLAHYYRQGKAVCTIERCFHPMFDVQFETGGRCKKHMNQLRSRICRPTEKLHDSGIDSPLPVSQAPIPPSNRFQYSGQQRVRQADSPRPLSEQCSGSPGDRRAAVPLTAAESSPDRGARAAPPAGADEPGGYERPGAEDRRAASPVRVAGGAASDANGREEGARRAERRYPERERRPPDRFGTWRVYL